MPVSQWGRNQMRYHLRRICVFWGLTWSSFDTLNLMPVCGEFWPQRRDPLPKLHPLDEGRQCPSFGPSRRGDRRAGGTPVWPLLWGSTCELGLDANRLVSEGKGQSCMSSDSWPDLLSWSERLECFAKQDPGRARQSS